MYCISMLTLQEARRWIIVESDRILQWAASDATPMPKGFVRRCFAALEAVISSSRRAPRLDLMSVGVVW